MYPNKEYVDFAINEMNIALKLIGNDLNNKKNSINLQGIFLCLGLIKNE